MTGTDERRRRRFRALLFTCILFSFFFFFFYGGYFKNLRTNFLRARQEDIRPSVQIFFKKKKVSVMFTEDKSISNIEKILLLFFCHFNPKQYLNGHLARKDSAAKVIYSTIVKIAIRPPQNTTKTWD